MAWLTLQPRPKPSSGGGILPDGGGGGPVQVVDGGHGRWRVTPSGSQWFRRQQNASNTQAQPARADWQATSCLCSVPEQPGSDPAMASHRTHPLTWVLSLLILSESQVRSLSDALREQALSDTRAAAMTLRLLARRCGPRPGSAAGATGSSGTSPAGVHGSGRPRGLDGSSHLSEQRTQQLASTGRPGYRIPFICTELWTLFFAGASSPQRSKLARDARQLGPAAAASVS